MRGRPVLYTNWISRFWAIARMRSAFTVRVFDITSYLARFGMQQHPGRAEFVPQHRKTGRKEGLLHRHEDLSPVREQKKDAIGFLVAVVRERQVGAANRLKAVRR